MAPSSESKGVAWELAQRLAGGRVYSREERIQLDAEALKHAFEFRRDLLSDSCSVPEVAELLGTSRQTPHDRVRTEQLLGVMDRGHLRLPRWQFDPDAPGGVVPGLADVLRALEASPLARASWFVRPNPYLEERTPAEVLRQGDRDRVVDAARLVGTAAA
jgi:hypothetical protein